MRLNLKHRKRLTTIGLSIFNNLGVPFFNAAISLLVIRLNSDQIWGGFVAVMIVVQFGAHLAAWGNKDYLLREFSRHPDQIAVAWWSSLVTRLAFALGLCLLLPLFGYSPQRLILAALWGIGIVLVQSFEVIVVYRKAFLFDTLLRGGTIAGMLLVLLLVGQGMTPDGLLALFAGAYAVQMIVYAVWFRDTLFQNPGRTHGYAPTALYTHLSYFGFDLGYFRLAFPFFLVRFSGLLASRIDLYAISYFLSDQEVGRYQVFINFMIYLQAIADFIIQPFIKNLYRLPDSTADKLMLRLFGVGLLLVVPAMPAIHWLLHTVYHLDFEPVFMLLGGLFALPVYGFVPLVYRFYKHNRQDVIIRVSLGSAALNLLMNALLVPQLDLVGAAAASAVVQWFMLAGYWLYSRYLFKLNG